MKALQAGSLGLNALLGLALAWTWPRAIGRNGMPERVVAGAASSESSRAPRPAAAATVDAAVRAPDWSTLGRDLAEGRYAAALTALRQAGLPENAIEDLVIGAINRRYGSQIAALRQGAPRFWEPVQRRKRDEAESERERAAGALEAERGKVVAELLGTDLGAYQARVTGQMSAIDQWTELFTPANRGRAREILTAFDAQERAVIDGASGTIGLPERAELDRLYREKLAGLRAVLTPAELDEYEVRTSRTSEELRQVGLIGFNPTEEEFRTIHRVRKAFDEAQAAAAASDPAAGGTVPMAQAQGALEMQLREALGEDRFRDYVRCQDYMFRGLVELTDQFDVPTESAVAVHTLRERVLVQTQPWLGETATPDSARAAALHTLRAETEETVRGLLGERAYTRYAQLSIGHWIAEIDTP